MFLVYEIKRHGTHMNTVLRANIHFQGETGAEMQPNSRENGALKENTEKVGKEFSPTG